MTRRAIVSVSDKTNVVELVKFLLKNSFEVYSTGGTYKLINSELSDDVNSPVINRIFDLTKFPEVLNGRVKTLHPHIYAGLLADKSNQEHLDDLKTHNLESIDLVVCNLYPFIESPSIENIDIGGVCLMRASGKNNSNVVLLSNPDQYQSFMDSFDGSDTELMGIRLEIRRELATQAFKFVSKYDSKIAEYMDYKSSKIPFELKYGMNPHQSETKIVFTDIHGGCEPFELINGDLSMINVIDIINGWLTVKEISMILKIPCVSSMKHTSLAGLAVGNGISETTLNYYNLSSKDQITPTSMAFMKSRLGDPLSSFGDFICVSGNVDIETAMLIKNEIADGIAAPSYSSEALEILKQKKSGNFKIVKMSNKYYTYMMENGWTETKKVYGIKLKQKNNNYINDFSEIKDEQLRIDHILAHTALKYAQSNNISMAVDGQLIGMGCGQQNRVGCVRLAGSKAYNWRQRQTLEARGYWNNNKDVKRQERVNLLYDMLEKDNIKPTMYNVVMASDGFFPFEDNIILANDYGVKHVIHPGGSIRDDDIKKKCDELGIGLYITNHRMFHH